MPDDPHGPQLDGQATFGVFADTLQRARLPLTARERLAEGLTGGAFLVAVATIWMLAPPGAFALAPAIACTVLLLLSLQVWIDTPFGHTVPAQLAFVPLVFAVPPAVVPLAVLAASLGSRGIDIAAGRAPLERLVQGVSNSWFSVGPAFVFAAAHTAPHDAGAMLLVAALRHSSASTSWSRQLASRSRAAPH